MNFDKLDRIIINRESLNGILKWRDENKELVRNYKPILNEGIIQYYPFYLQHFKFDNGKIIHMVYFHDKLYIKIILDYKTNMALEEWSDEENNILSNYNRKEAMKDAVTVHASLMAYIENFQKEKQLVNIERHKIINNKPTKKSKRNQVVTFKNVYNVYLPSQDAEKNSERHYAKHTDAWTVRGHYRYYKNGKKIWIKPYKKGIGEIDAKIYNI